MSNQSDANSATGGSQTPFAVLRKHTLITLQKVSEALRECSLLNKGLESQIENQVRIAHAKLERIDTELNDQFNIIQILVGSLHQKKVDAKLLYDKVVAASNCQNTLQQVLNKLSESQIAGGPSSDEQQIGAGMSQNKSEGLRVPDQKGAENMTSSSPQRDLSLNNTGSFPQGVGTSSVHEELKQRGIRTLWDFVEEDSIREVTGRAEISYQQLQIVYQRYADHVEGLVRKVDAHLSRIIKAKSDCAQMRGAVLEKLQRIQQIIGEVHKLFKTIEKAQAQLETLGQQPASQQVSSEQCTRQIQQLNQLLAQSEAYMDQLSNEREIIRTSIEAYRMKNEHARESFVAFVNFAPQVQQFMQEVDKWQSQFELKRQQTMEEFDEVEKLRTWYEYFQKSYISMEQEIERRRHFEMKLHAKVQAMRALLESELESEQRARIAFNEQHHRYLPQNLKVMLEEPPTQYQLYPNTFEFEETGMMDPNQLDEARRFIEELLSQPVSSDQYELQPNMQVQDNYFITQQNQQQQKERAPVSFDDSDNFDCCDDIEDDKLPVKEQASLNKGGIIALGGDTSTKTSEEEERQQFAARGFNNQIGKK